MCAPRTRGEDPRQAAVPTKTIVHPVGRAETGIPPVRGFCLPGERATSNRFARGSQLVALCVYSYFSYGQWQAMKDQKWVMQGQLEQMKGSSTQTDKLIGETHTLATNAGAQAANAADEVKKLGALVDATNKQASATNGQLSVMQKQLEATDRAWIAIELSVVNVPGAFIGGPLVFDGNGRGSMGIEVRARKIGKSVANSASVRIDAFALPILESISKTPEQRQRKLCESRDEKRVMRSTILPNDTGGIYASIGFDTKDIPNAMPELKNGKPIVVFVYGCVDYESADSLTRHQTGFVLQAFGSRDTNKGIQVGATVAADQLTFRPYQFFGGNSLLSKLAG